MSRLRIRSPAHEKGFMLRVAVALIGIMLVAVSVLNASPVDTIEVELTVEYADSTSFEERQIEDQLKSYFRRELRALGDVVIPETSIMPDVTVSVLGMPQRSSTRNTIIGHILTVGASTAYGGFREIGSLRDRVEGDSIAEELVSVVSLEFVRLRIAYRDEAFRTIHFWGDDLDMLRNVRRVVASIDSQVFEPLR